MLNFSNLASLVALRVCFGLQDNSDAPFTRPFNEHFAYGW